MKLRQQVLCYLDQHIDDRKACAREAGDRQTQTDISHDVAVVRMIRNKVENDEKLSAAEFMELLDILQQEVYS